MGNACAKAAEGVRDQAHQAVSIVRTTWHLACGRPLAELDALQWQSVPAMQRKMGRGFALLFLPLSLVFFALNIPIRTYLRWMERRRVLNARELESTAMFPPRSFEPHVCTAPSALMRRVFNETPCTLDHTVYVYESSGYVEDGAVWPGLMQHELCHAYQYERFGGFCCFLGLYCAYIAVDAVKCGSVGEAYRMNPFEEEAYSCQAGNSTSIVASRQSCGPQ